MCLVYLLNILFILFHILVFYVLIRFYCENLYLHKLFLKTGDRIRFLSINVSRETFVLIFNNIILV